MNKKQTKHNLFEVVSSQGTVGASEVQFAALESNDALARARPRVRKLQIGVQE